MTTNKELQQALNELYERYGNTLKLLSDSLDQIDKLEKRKPKTIIKEVQVEKEKIVTVEKPIEIEKETIRIVEKEVPGPERIVEVPGPERTVERIVEIEKIVEVPVTEFVDKIVTITNPADAELSKENKQLKAKIEELELQKEKIVTVEKEATGDLKEAARLLAASEMNKEDLSEGQIFKLLQKSSEEEVKKKIGFWAQPLPSPDKPEATKRYMGKK